MKKLNKTLLILLCAGSIMREFSRCVKRQYGGKR